MAPKLSAEMTRARELLRAGMSAADAARDAGLTKGAISNDAVCKVIIAENKSAKMKKVHDYVQRGVTWRGACEEFGVTQGGYSRWRARELEKKHAENSDGA